MNKIWVVKDPPLAAATISLADFMFDMTPKEHARYVVGTGLAEYERQNHTIHFTEESAKLETNQRVERLELGIAGIRRQLPSSDPARDLTALWASLRARASLDEIVDMVRQDLESLPSNTDHAQGLAGALMAACHAAESG